MPSGGILQLPGAAPAPARSILEGERDEVEWQHGLHDEAIIRRRRRRKRRKRRNTLKRIYIDDDEEEEEEDDGFVMANKKAGKSRFMSAKEEARFSWYLKVYTAILTP